MSLTPEIIQELSQKLEGKDSEEEKHIMLSYNWGVQELVIKVHDYIESKGIRCWMDVKGGVTGCINSAMALGVEGAMVICPFMTEKYQESESCKLELSYAKDLEVQIVPCMAQTEDSKGNSYKQKGWLGVITAGKLWTDFRDCIEDETLIEERTDKLLLEIASKLDVDTRGGFKPAKPAAAKPAAKAAPNPKPAEIKSTTPLVPPPPKPAPKTEPAPKSSPQKATAQKPAATKQAIPKTVSVDDLLYNTKKITLKGYHNKFVNATNDGCRNDNCTPSAACNVQVEVIKGNCIALKSCHGKYLSAQPNGSVQWNRDKAQAWEHFTVGKVNDNTISLKSFHGKFLSAQQNGNMQVNRDKCFEWEHFEVHPCNDEGSKEGKAPKLVSTLLEGSHKMVRIRKLTGPGQGYYLTCHGDTRNGHSTWVLAHKPRENDQDNFWNLMAWNQDGVVCHKIQKAVHRNSTMMLTSHSDPKKPNGDMRVLAHKADHNVPDECWQIIYNGAGTFRIVKCLNRNKNMALVGREKRNQDSFWVDITSEMGDSWAVETESGDLHASEPQTVPYPADGGGTLKNLALKRPTVYQSSVFGGAGPERAVDGSTDGTYNKKGVMHTASAKDNGLAWWHCDLGDWYKITRVVVYNRTECEDRLNNAQVFLGKKLIGIVKQTKGQQEYEFFADNYNSRNVTVALMTGQPLHMAQVEVWGTGTKGFAMTDVALKKSCFQSSTAHGGDASRAVNGVENGLYVSGNTTHTDSNKDGQRAWWYVDLGANYKIFEIDVLNRYECAERLNGAQIFIDQDLVGTIDQRKGIHWYHIAVPGGKFGSRVGVTLNTGQPLSLTQVMVMSDMTTQ